MPEHLAKLHLAPHFLRSNKLEETIVEQPAVEESPEQVEIKSLRQAKQTLEQSLSRQGYELGELRKVTDKILLSQVDATPDEPVDFFTDPDKAVDQRIAKSPKLQEIDNLTMQLRQQAMIGQLKTEHPDYKEIVEDENFQNWVASSKVRVRLFQEADKGYEIDSANELLSTWKERQSIKNTGEAEANVKNDKEKALKAARVDTGTSTVNSKKVYSRLDLMRLRTTDPTAYKSLDVTKLYAEGRVK